MRTNNDLIEKLRELGTEMSAPADFKNQVRQRVFAEITPLATEEKPSWSWWKIAFSGMTGIVAIMTVFVGSFFLKTREVDAYIGYLQIADTDSGSVQIESSDGTTAPVVIEKTDKSQPTRIRIKKGDVIKTSSGATITLNFDNNTKAVVTDTAVVKINQVEEKNPEGDAKTISVVLEKGTIETKSDAKNPDSILQVQTNDKVVDTQNASVTVNIDDNGKTNVKANPTEVVTTTETEGKISIQGAVNQNGNGNQNSSPTNTPQPSPTVSPSPSPKLSATPAPSPTASPTGSGSILKIKGKK